MKIKTFCFCFLLVLALIPAAFAGKTELTTYYPAPYGEYQDLEVKSQIVGGFGGMTTAGSTDWNDATNARSGNGYTLLRGDATNGPSGIAAYYHPFNFEYNSKDGTGNMTQLAIPYYSNYSNAGDVLWLRTRFSGTWSSWHQILTENASGRVGIGTTSPLGRFQVTCSSGATSNSYFTTNDFVSGSTGSNLLIDFGAATGNTYTRLSAVSNGSTVWNNLILQSAGGNVGIGTTAPTSRLHAVAPIGTHGIYGSTGVDSSHYGVIGYGGAIYGALGRGDGYAFVGTGIVWATGAGQFNMSDGRLKENVITLSSNLEKIGKLRPVSFTWKSDSAAYLSAHDKPQLGLIAQEVKPVVPEAVILNPKPPVGELPGGKKFLDEKYPEGTYGVDYTKMVPILIGAVQEQQAEIELLKKEVAELKKK